MRRTWRSHARARTSHDQHDTRQEEHQMARQRRSGPKPATPVPYQLPKGPVQAQKGSAEEEDTWVVVPGEEDSWIALTGANATALLAEMDTSEFRAWLKAQPEETRERWRKRRRDLKKADYDHRRLFLLANPPWPLPTEADVTDAVKKTEGMTPEQLRKFVASLPENVRLEVRRHLKRESWRRWAASHDQEHRARSRENWQKLRNDPEKYAEYKARKAAQMRERRARQREAAT
jgi:hypothetical protein